MSFDTIFDYTPVKTYINDRITNLQNEKGNSVNELIILGNLSPQYSNICTDIIDYHNKILEHIDTPINRLGNVLNEIISIENLQSDSKNVLYNFYETHVKYEPEEFNYKVHWMRQMLYHTNDLITCAEMLNNDGNITPEQCNCVANLIWTKFTPHPWTVSFHNILWKHKIQTGNI